MIELQIDKTGPKYNASFESFESILSSLFEKAILSTQSVPQLEKVKSLFWRKFLSFYFISFF